MHPGAVTIEAFNANGLWLQLQITPESLVTSEAFVFWATHKRLSLFPGNHQIASFTAKPLVKLKFFT